MMNWRAPLHAIARGSANPVVQWTLFAVAMIACGIAAYVVFRAPPPVTLKQSGVSQSATARSERAAAIEALRLATAAQTYAPVSPEEAQAINAARPITPGTFPAARPYAVLGATPESWSRAVDCLAAAIHYEAASESESGRSAVAQVVLNRLRHPAFPKTVCGVVFQGAERSTGCQFTFTCDGSLARVPSEPMWRTARALAEAALSGRIVPQVGWSTNYHTASVVPYWSDSLVKTAVIGAHIFYRIPGVYGSAKAFSAKPSIEEPMVSRMVELSMIIPPIEVVDLPVDDIVTGVTMSEPDPVAILPTTTTTAAPPPPEREASPEPRAEIETTPAAPPAPVRVERRRGRLPM